MAQPQSQISNTLIQNMQNFNNVSAMPGMQPLIGPQGLQSLQAHIQSKGQHLNSFQF